MWESDKFRGKKVIKYFTLFGMLNVDLTLFCSYRNDLISSLLLFSWIIIQYWKIITIDGPDFYITIKFLEEKKHYKNLILKKHDMTLSLKTYNFLFI